MLGDARPAVANRIGNRPQARPSLRLLTMPAWLAADRACLAEAGEGEDLPAGQLAVVLAVARDVAGGFVAGVVAGLA